MSTAAQQHANQQNAKLSTGPRTSEGKLRSSLNAIKHGLFAQDPLVPGEDPEAFEEHVCETLRDLQPCSYTEEQLAEQIADISWRLKRHSRIEAAVITEFYDDAAAQPSNQGSNKDLIGKALAHHNRLDALNRLSRYEGQLSRRYHRSLKEFHDTRQRRIRGLNLSAAFGRQAAKLRAEQSKSEQPGSEQSGSKQSANNASPFKKTEPTQSLVILLESIAPMSAPASDPAPIDPPISNHHPIHQESPGPVANMEAKK